MQGLLKAVADQALKGCSFWPMCIFSRSFCNKEKGKSQEKELVASMKGEGLIFQDFLTLHTKPMTPYLKGITFHGKMCTGQIQQGWESAKGQERSPCNVEGRTDLLLNHCGTPNIPTLRFNLPTSP